MKLLHKCQSFVTIKIFARTEPPDFAKSINSCFVTIKIFARTELKQVFNYDWTSFVTIKIFARTERYVLYKE